MRSWSGQKNHTLVFIVHLVSGEFSRHMKILQYLGRQELMMACYVLLYSNECNHCEFLKSSAGTANSRDDIRPHTASALEFIKKK
jgi:hypothetical protein